MATQSFFVLNGVDVNSQAEVVIKGKDKEELGAGVKMESPEGRKYVVAKLDGYWIISEKDYKILRKIK